MTGLVGTSDNVGAVNTPNATSSEPWLPGEPYFFRGPAAEAVSPPARFTLRHVVETGSTNDDLVAAAAKGTPDGLVLVADGQTAGKGRLNRQWVSEPGVNLLVSVLFRRIPRYPHQLTHAMALAAQTAALKSASVKAALKWPNDLLVDGRKVAGILSVAGGGTSPSGGPMFVVVGLGLNVGWAPEGAASLAGACGHVVDRDAVLAHLLTALDTLLDLDEQQLFNRYRSRLDTLRRKVRVEMPNDEILEGRALDVEIDGRLQVLDQRGVTRALDIGDIVHLR